MNPANGLVADTSRPDSPVSIAVVGFALSAYPIAVERGWMTRTDALARSLAALRFFSASDQSGSPEATGYKGFYYHFLHLHTGARVWRSELSTIDTALLIAGALTASMYFSANTPDELALRELVDALYRRIDWRWAQVAARRYGKAGSPNADFSTTAGRATARPSCCTRWRWAHRRTRSATTATMPGPRPTSGRILYGYDLLYAGPLFVHQFSHAWIDFRGIRDPFMREKRCDYFENSRRATHVQREYARRNPLRFVGYDEDCWGLTACDGPGNEVARPTNERRRSFGYAARGVPYGPDDGTLSGWAALASLPFAPEIALSAARNMYRRYPEMRSGQRYASAFNPTLSGASGGAWVSPGYFGLDQGIVMMMIENHRSELIWRLMRNCTPVAAGLRRAGFRGGWL